MHYSILLVIDEPTDERIAELMEPYGDGREWDFFAIGGRWTGLFDGYDPEKDERNIETCTFCGGTGDRKDLEPPEWKAKCGGCNSCHGTGKRAKWPTQWEKHPGDILPIELLTAEQYDKFFAFCCDYGWFGGEEYLPWEKEKKFRERDKPPIDWLKTQGKFAVVIDCHN